MVQHNYSLCLCCGDVSSRDKDVLLMSVFSYPVSNHCSLLHIIMCRSDNITHSEFGDLITNPAWGGKKAEQAATMQTPDISCVPGVFGYRNHVSMSLCSV